MKLHEFKGSLGEYKLVETEDGQATLFSEYFNENCHSTSGAREETIYNYIEGCELSLKTHDTLNILEVGLGAGIGVVETLKFAIENKRKIHFITTELDELLAKTILKNEIITNKLKQVNEFNYSSEYFNLEVLIGNARETISKIPNHSIHAIYQDPFSPKRNPILWTKEWFSDLREKAHEDCVLSTYSSSVAFRKALIESGWKVFTRKGFGQKRTCTQARLSGTMNENLLRELTNSSIQALSDNL